MIPVAFWVYQQWDDPVAQKIGQINETKGFLICEANATVLLLIVPLFHSCTLLQLILFWSNLILNKARNIISCHVDKRDQKINGTSQKRTIIRQFIKVKKNSNTNPWLTSQTK